MSDIEDEIETSLKNDLQTEQVQEMIERFTSLCTFMTLGMLLQTTIDTEEGRKEVLESMLTKWEEFERKRLTKEKEMLLSNPLHKIILGDESIEEGIRISECAIEETKSKLRFTIQKMLTEQG